MLRIKSLIVDIHVVSCRSSIIAHRSRCIVHAPSSNSLWHANTEFFVMSLRMLVFLCIYEMVDTVVTTILYLSRQSLHYVLHPYLIIKIVTQQIHHHHHELFCYLHFSGIRKYEHTTYNKYLT